MAKLPRPDTAAGLRYEEELNLLKRSAKNQFVSQRITAGQLMYEAGLGDFLLSLDTQAFANASPEKRRELIELAFNTAAKIIGGKAFSGEPALIKQQKHVSAKVATPPAQPQQEAVSVTPDVPNEAAQEEPEPEPEQPKPFSGMDMGI